MGDDQQSALPGRYQQFHDRISTLLPTDQVTTYPLKTLAYGTDAGLYSLIPKIIIKSDSEVEIVGVLADAHELPITFRAAGRSLSGQAISDSIIPPADEKWQRYKVLQDGERIRLPLRTATMLKGAARRKKVGTNLEIDRAPKFIFFPSCISHTMGPAKHTANQKLLFQVVIPEKVRCCGFANDCGFTYPELNRSTLEVLSYQDTECRAGDSNSGTSEIGLSGYDDNSYTSIVCQVGECSRKSVA